MKKIFISIIISLFVASCANKPPETIVDKKWGVTDEGSWEEQETHSTTIYDSEDNEMPELKLPTDKSKKEK